MLSFEFSIFTEKNYISFHMIFWKQVLKMTVAQQTLQSIRLFVRNTRSPKCFQPEATIHTFRALPAADLLSIKFRLSQVNYEAIYVLEKLNGLDASRPAKGVR